MRKEDAKITLRNYVMEYQQINNTKLMLKQYPYAFYLGALTYARTSEDVASIKQAVFATLKSPSQSF